MARKNNHLGLKVGLGVAAAAAAAGALYFFGKDGAKNRKSSGAWVNKAKQDVLAQIRRLKEVNEKTYNAVSAKVMKKYAKFQKENPEAYALLAKEFKTYWPKIAKHLPKTVKKAIRSRSK